MHTNLQQPSAHSDLTAFIRREAGKCVACGLCLPHCPTYTLLRDETESPRGRLALMLGLAKNELPWSVKLESHLTRCLDCRACEKACPSYVSYGQILDATRTLIETSRLSSVPRTSKSVTMLHWLVERRNRIRALGKLLRLYQLSGLQQLVRLSRMLRYRGLAQLEANLPKLLPQKPFAKTYKPQKLLRGQVALFTGCIASITDRQTLNSTIQILNRLGHEVRVPSTQECCGALHLHHGESKKSTALMNKNIQAFPDETDTVVCTASGCTATLCEYGKYVEADKNPSAQKFANRVMDISQFLINIDWPSNISFRPLAKRIVVHNPCTLTNVLRQENSPYTLLAQIPDAEILPLPDNHLCCGAAGSYHLTETKIAQQLRAAKIAHLEKLAPDILVTSNPGCAMFLAAGMRERELLIEVAHPVVLLERQMDG